MSRLQGLTSDRAATAEELLDWLIEHQESSGAAGLSTHWPVEDFPKVFSVVADPADQCMLFEGRDVDLDTCLGWAVRDHMRDHWLEKTIKDHHALYPSVDKLLYSRLRALGVPASELDQTNPSQKLSMLANAKTPRKPDIPTFTVFLILARDAEGDEMDKIELTFRLDDSFVRFQAVLRDISCYSAMRHGQAGGYTLCDGPWCYRFVGSNGLVVPGLTRVEMVDESGYRMMVKQLVQSKYRAASFCHMMTLRLFEKQVLVNRRLREEEMEHDRQLRAGHDGDVELDCHQHPYFLDRIDWVGLRRRFRLGKDITGGVDLFN